MIPLADHEEARLLEIARESLAHGLRHSRALPVAAERESARLAAPGASFVTLRGLDRALRGCIGTLEPRRALVVDVAENAYRAGFCDPRFAPLEPVELQGLQVQVSLLGAPERLEARTREELVAVLRPGADGLILCIGERRATFLPEVWHSLPSPDAFVGALLRKAGLPERFWSDRVEAYRYATRSIPDEAAPD